MKTDMKTVIQSLFSKKHMPETRLDSSLLTLAFSLLSSWHVILTNSLHFNGDLKTVIRARNPQQDS